MDWLTLIFNLGIPILLLLLGYFIGSLAERNHFRSIVKREKALINRPAVTFDEMDDTQFPPDTSIARAELVSGSVVISVDYFKRFLAGLRAIFGGRVSAYETLVDRARREAVLRMKERAGDADRIANLRIETSTLSSGAGIGSVEVHAYGTALYNR
ncbi:MAG: heavy metal-binding domain-containing protein [Pseudomonadota bacterium]